MILYCCGAPGGQSQQKQSNNVDEVRRGRVGSSYQPPSTVRRREGERYV